MKRRMISRGSLLLLFIFHLVDGLYGQNLRPTLYSTYPQLLSARNISYFQDSNANHHLVTRWIEWIKPDFKTFISNSTLKDNVDLTADYTEVISINDSEFFIIFHLGSNRIIWGDSTVYRVTPACVEQLYTFGKHRSILPNQTNVARWRFEYNADGKIRQYTAWFIPFEVNLKPAITKTYEYWDDTGALRSTIEKRNGQSIFKKKSQRFDSSGTKLLSEITE